MFSPQYGDTPFHTAARYAIFSFLVIRVIIITFIMIIIIITMITMIIVIIVITLRYGHAGVIRILASAKCKVSEQNKVGLLIMMFMTVDDD